MRRTAADHTSFELEDAFDRRDVEAGEIATRELSEVRRGRAPAFACMLCAMMLGGAFVLAACTSAGRVVKIYQDPTHAGVPFASFLVVGVHEDRDIRWQFEDALVHALRAGGESAASAIMLMESGEPLDADALVAAARTVGADAVLVTRLLDVESSTEVESGRVSAEAERRSDVTIADFFRYEYHEYQDPMSITTTSTVVTATDLYDLSDRAKVWSVESTAFEKESVYELIDSLSAAIARQLERDGLTG